MHISTKWRNHTNYGKWLNINHIVSYYIIMGTFATATTIPPGGSDTVQPPPNTDLILRKVFSNNSTESWVTNGNYSRLIGSGEITDEIPMNSRVYLRIENTKNCASQTSFCHAVEV